jgi:hypothetical protein
MAEKCTWIVFHAHPTQFLESEDEHPDFHGTFVCPSLRSEPELLLAEVLTNRKLFLAEITDHRMKAMEIDWGMNERLKAQMDEQGFGLALTKLQRGMTTGD